jgi:hypothetical protein
MSQHTLVTAGELPRAYLWENEADPQALTFAAMALNTIAVAEGRIDAGWRTPSWIRQFPLRINARLRSISPAQ